MFAIRSALFAVFLLTPSAVSCSQTPPVSGAGDMKRYVSPDSSYTLYKPQDWKVHEQTTKDSVRIVVSDPAGTSLAEVYCAANTTGKPDALRLLAGFMGSLKAEHPDLTFSGVYVAKDASKAVAMVSYGRDRAPVEGRYYFDSTPKQLSVQGYCAPSPSKDWKCDLRWIANSPWKVTFGPKSNLTF